MSKKLLLLLAFVLFFINLFSLFVHAGEFEGKDVSFCDNINGSQRYSCYEELAKQHKEVLFCERISGEEWLLSRQDDCFEEVAILTLNLSICDRLNYGDNKKSCYGEIAVKKENITMCSQFLFDQLNQDYCYKDIAISTKNDSICLKISDPDTLNYCYEEVARAARDPEICEKIKKDIWSSKDTCFHIIATDINDSSICGRISHGGTRVLCYHQVSDKLDIASSGKIYVVGFAIMLLLVTISAIFKIIKSKLKNKGICLGIITGAIIAFLFGVYHIQFPVSIIKESAFLFEVLLKLVGYSILGGFIGFTIGGLIVKLKKPIWTGTILGFYIGVLIAILSFVYYLDYSGTKYKIVGFINPIIWIAKKVGCSGEICLAFPFVIIISTVLFFTALGLLIGFLSEKRIKRINKCPPWLPAVIGAFCGLIFLLFGFFSRNYFIESVIDAPTYLLEGTFGDFAWVATLFLWGFIGGLIGHIIYKIFIKLRSRR